MSRRFRIFCISACLAYLVLSFASAEALVRSYVEDFSSVQYCDTLNTTAWWDTAAGEVKLPTFQLTLAASYGTPAQALGVAISGDYAYVGDCTSGLQVIDISDPTSPTPAGSYNTPGCPWSVVPSGDHAYIADGGGGLRVIDISDPTAPALAGSYDTPDYAYGVAISGDYAYVADGDSGLHVIDISDPTTPTLTASYDTPDYARGVALSGDYVYVADELSGLQVIDISDPANPDSAGNCNTPSIAMGVAISGDYAYVADYQSGLQVIDITNPVSPTLAGSYDTPDRAWGVAIWGGYAYVADQDSGLQVINISSPTGPALAGSYDTPDKAHGVALSGDYAYVADELSGLQVIDITNPASPTLGGSCDTPGQAYGVAISGDYAYVASAYSGLQVIDIGDPTGPTLAGSYNTPNWAYGVAMSGDYAYVVDGGPGVLVIDISDPTSPALAGSCDTPGNARGVAISGDCAYVADYTSGLQVIDISDPTSPTVVGSYDTPGSAFSIAIWGDYAYIGDYWLLTVIDISDPTSPALAGSCDTPGYAEDVAVWGDYAYVADDTSGLQVIDISDPTSPTLAGSYDTPDRALGVAISGDYAYVADCGSGLKVVEIFQRTYDTRSNTAQSLTVDEADETIVRARLNAAYSDSVYWELSADSGNSWQEFQPGAAHQAFIAPGSNLLWRSCHFYTGAGINPACSNLEIDWLYEFAMIDSIVDVPGDQGRQVRVHWTRSGHDFPYGPIVDYAIYRRIDQSQALSGDAAPFEHGPGLLGVYPPGDWDYVASVPAAAEETYATVVPTLADSSISDGMHYTIFFIRASTDTLGIHFDSYPDSGYSVDNLAPSPPAMLTMTSAAEIAWDESHEADFNYFTVYGSGVPGLDTAAVLIGYTIETVMDVSGDVFDYYHVTATDFAGNEGDASSVENTYAGVGRGEVLPAVFALKPSRPNPFESETMVAFDLPEPCKVRLEVVDVRGRVVRVLTDKAWPAGRHPVVWTGENEAGEAVGPGVYFVRIQAGEFAAKTKMLRMR